jgi:PPM family protein phosphatase
LKAVVRESSGFACTRDHDWRGLRCFAVRFGPRLGLVTGSVCPVSALMMRSAVATEVGPRERNEDAAFASPRLVAVADGVGGATAGEVASRLAIQKMRGLEARRLEHPLEFELSAAVADANAVIEFVISCEPHLAGMGTTLTAVALSNEGDYLVANVGDSRTYLHRDGRLLRLTRDHSLVQMLIDRGVLTEDDARRHPQRSVVLEALDGVERALPPVERVKARAGDRLLLCSDGVTDYVSDRQIAQALTARDAGVAVREITRLALEHGARDNVTAVVADLAPRTDPSEGWLDYLPAADTSR